MSLGKVTRRRVWLSVGMAALVLYVGSYVALSRFSWRARRSVGMPGFCYAPCRPGVVAPSPVRQLVNYELYVFYYPVWVIDHYAMGGPVALTHVDSLRLSN